MKSTNWVINGVLALAIVILYVLHFSGGTATSKKATLQDAGGTKVAYFEIDSIQNNYIFFKDVKDALQLKDMENAKQLTALKNAFSAKYQDLQKNGQYLSQGEVVARQQELQQLEKNYANTEQQLTQALQEESYRKLQEVKKKIEAFILKSSNFLIISLKEAIIESRPSVKYLLLVLLKIIYPPLSPKSELTLDFVFILKR